MKCPSCGGLDIRLSRRSPRFSFFYEVRGYERYRCRECRRAFWGKPADDLDERTRRTRQRGWSRAIRTQGRRRTIEIAIFITMLMIFVLAIRYIINKGDATPFSFLSSPACSVGPLLNS